MADPIAWSAGNVLIQAVAGIFGSHAAAIAAHEHRFGFLGHTVAGALTGIASGYFLQTAAVTMVTQGGAMNEPTAVENAVLQSFTGLVVGGCAMLAVGMVRQLAAEHRTKTNGTSDD